MKNLNALANQRGHMDYAGLYWMLIFAVLVCFVLEAIVITGAVVFWKHLGWRIILSAVAIAGIIFIAHTGWHFFK